MMGIHSEEIWVPIAGYERYYEVSNMGRIRSLDRVLKSKTGKSFIKPGRIRKLVVCPNGYSTIFLVGDAGRACYLVHRIVAEAFCENPDNCTFVNHINEIKTDNRAENLEWCTRQYNNTYNGKTQRCCKPVEQFTLEGVSVAVWKSARQASAQINGANYKNISAVCRGKRKSAGGYLWRFANV